MLRCRYIFIVLFIALLNAGPLVNGYRFMRCELTKTLLNRYRFPKTFISNWVCLIEHESGADTSKVTRLNSNKAAFGLFQIGNDNYCRMGRKGGYCKKKCEDFMDDYLDDDAECAKIIFDREGFKYWRGWLRYCANPQNLPSLNTLCNYRK